MTEDRVRDGEVKMMGLRQAQEGQYQQTTMKRWSKMQQQKRKEREKRYYSS